ncbi:MAG TPA: PIN domain-containing protein [Planctomycetota bacterium]|nr:PIN domain-containing protein [Planctomycetota bacterium]HRR79206.1 PIN domain-containing protein [Planctomycetota bacterium]HRT94231.1 PIN domain-containing protein [Planctomycetota bacterium]
MRETFADTFYYLAMLHADDAAHERAVKFSSQLTGPTVTTAWVLTELADGLAAPATRGSFVRLLASLRADHKCIIIPASQELFELGMGLYQERPDKGWTLTDCVSFVVMKDRGIRDALTADHHFEQAGFTALLG